MIRQAASVTLRSEKLIPNLSFCAVATATTMALGAR
eukprot:CAMPEP_0197434290 /NCGR_PEP_ID=MMETSP1175-20131217/2049_1 /TAXON_ID=1003142 /ORGANISM="Triceratium dubium, Strain CCMP147" /LENGTH=35 /DNA_ID= /DNA_START= /DNA_END= /DNA_ORIENTATION=